MFLSTQVEIDRAFEEGRQKTLEESTLGLKTLHLVWKKKPFVTRGGGAKPAKAELPRTDPRVSQRKTQLRALSVVAVRAAAPCLVVF